MVLIKIMIEEYINHISPYHFKLVRRTGAVQERALVPPNWMAIEFNLLYRWHGLIPTTQRRRHREPIWRTVFDPTMLVEHGLARLLRRRVAPARRPDRPAQHRARVPRGRANSSSRAAPSSSALQRLPRAVGYPRVTGFDQISGDPEIQAGLRDLYGHVDRIELYPGLFAEDTRPKSALPSLIGRLVGVDAFSQALTNPLLSPRVFNAATFSPLGMELIRTTGTLSDILHRNVPESPGRHSSP